MRLPSLLIGIPSLALGLFAPLWAQQPSRTPVHKGLEEEVQVTLVQIEALVVDKEGRTVPDLTKGDFSMTIAGVPVVVSSVDLMCPIGAAADPAPLKATESRPRTLIAPGMKRRVVFAFDYSYLDSATRSQVLDAAEWMLRMSKTDEEEVMIVALTSQVRIEQKFTKRLVSLIATLSRMKHDVTLWAQDFPVGTRARGYFGNISTMMDVLGSYDGPKAVILFSQASDVGASKRDLYYDDVAAHAVAGRASIYPAKPDRLNAVGPGDTMVRLANKTGGRMHFVGDDLSVPYRRAQRDLACRYTVAAYVDSTESRAPQSLSVKMRRPGLFIRTSEMIQLFTEDAKQQARARAAYVDPGPYERPLVRAFAFSAVPAGVNTWDTLFAVSFPAPADAAEVDVRAVIRGASASVGEYVKRIHVDPASEHAAARTVTVLGNTKLSDGQYDVTVVLTDPTGSEIVTAQTNFVVPQVVQDQLMLRGPILGRAASIEQFLRANAKPRPVNARRGKLLSPQSGFEPLMVQEIDTKDALSFYWSACVSGRTPLEEDVMVARTLVDGTGEVVKAFDPVPLKLDSRGHDISCMDLLETLPGGTLASGDYHLDVTVTSANGDFVARGTSPLNVR